MVEANQQTPELAVIKAVAQATSLLIVNWKTLNDAFDRGIGFKAIQAQELQPEKELEALREATSSSDSDQLLSWKICLIQQVVAATMNPECQSNHIEDFLEDLLSENFKLDLMDGSACKIANSILKVRDDFFENQTSEELDRLEAQNKKFNTKQDKQKRERAQHMLALRGGEVEGVEDETEEKEGDEEDWDDEEESQEEDQEMQEQKFENRRKPKKEDDDGFTMS